MGTLLIPIKTLQIMNRLVVDRYPTTRSSHTNFSYMYVTNDDVHELRRNANFATNLIAYLKGYIITDKIINFESQNMFSQSTSRRIFHLLLHHITKEPNLKLHVNDSLR